MSKWEFEKCCWCGGVLFYVVCGFLEFGHVQNTVPCDTITIYETKREDCHDRDGKSVVRGAAWPIYYIGEFAIWITRP